ncbi:MAG: glycosyltransferase family 39 protein [Candidatus Buchananbacteria bacterium]|nr:glycosyltransferase family 39 protein [Candidatus Buchananbacteria bacterium]
MLKRSSIGLSVVGLVFLVVYVWLAAPLNSGTNVSPRFDWPDETANYFWSQQFASTGELKIAEPLNQLADNQIHPRSFNVDNAGSLVPGSFLGLILIFGVLAKIFSSGIIIYLTPIISVIGIFAFYGIIKRIFDQKIAFWSAVLAFFNPAWWYYSASSLLPNVVFICLLLISFYFLTIVNDSNKEDVITPYAKIRPSNIFYLNFILAGIFGGLAVSIRPSEIVWIGFIYLVIFYWLKTKINWLKIIVFAFFAFLAISPTLYYQQLIFGHWYVFGYDHLQFSGSAAGCSACQGVKNLFLPFGFHPALAVANFWSAMFSRFWLWFLLALLGYLALATGRKKIPSRIYNYFLVGGIVSAFLFLYYGSWQFTDLLTLNLNTLGISYVRYWLPIFLFIIPLVAVALNWFGQFFSRKNIQPIFIIVLLILFYQSLNLVLYQNQDSLLPVKQRIVEYKKIASQVNQVTSDNSVIVTVRKDKVFFPDRKVIHSFDPLPINKELLSSLSNLVDQVPVYYYALSPESNLNISSDLHLEPVIGVSFGLETLYQVIKS